MIIGAHVSVAGGLKNGVFNAQKLGVSCIQIFGSSPRQWNTRTPSAGDIDEYKTALRGYPLKAVFLHAAYLPNLGAANKDIWMKSVKNLSEHLRIAEMIGADGLIFHIGSAGKEVTKDEAIKRTVQGMKQILKNVPGKSCLIMENTAGSGQKIGANPKELGIILRQIKSSRIKVCFDTAHAFEGGTIEKYEPKSIKALFDEWDEDVGLDNLAAVHANDSKTKFNSKHDRHENIGKGYIGLSGFKNLAREKRINKKPWLLEVPGFDGAGPDKKNVEILKSCFR